jgi:hypothetical protein
LERRAPAVSFRTTLTVAAWCLPCCDRPDGKGIGDTSCSYTDIQSQGQWLTKFAFCPPCQCSCRTDEVLRTANKGSKSPWSPTAAPEAAAAAGRAGSKPVRERSTLSGLVERRQRGAQGAREAASSGRVSGRAFGTTGGFIQEKTTAMSLKGNTAEIAVSRNISQN